VNQPANLDALTPVVAAADAAGLQVALHAIGDKAVRIALDALEHAADVNGPRPRRHRIEHLEYTDPADIPRVARLGVTASMQHVHADPAIQDNWRAMLGDARVERRFAWPEFVDAGARLSLGTDTPTAPYHPLRNLYVAATRRSAIDPAAPPTCRTMRSPSRTRPGTPPVTRPGPALGRRPRAAGEGPARRPGGLDRDPFAEGPDVLLDARVLHTVVDGRRVGGNRTG
jgi:predicted amidohydrolase YtcJ